VPSSGRAGRFRERLAHYKFPTRVIVTELPKTSTGKIQRFLPRAMADART
jgi:fatty-acyl-CoA synthase